MNPDWAVDFYVGTGLTSLTNILSLSSAAATGGDFTAARAQDYLIRVNTGGAAFTLKILMEGLKLIGPNARPLAGQSYPFEIVLAESAGTLAEVTASLNGVEIGTRTNAPFTIEALSQTNGSVQITAAAKTITGDLFSLVPTSIYFRPRNDDFAAAIVLPEALMGQRQEGSSAGATLEPDEPAHPKNLVRSQDISGWVTLELPPSGSAWWKWTPTHSSESVLNLGAGSVAIYKGTSLTSLTLVTNASYQTPILVVHAWDNPFGDGSSGPPSGTASLGPTFAVQAGETYWIAELSSGAFSWSIFQRLHHLEFAENRAGAASQFFLRGDADAPQPQSVTLDIRRKTANDYSPTVLTNIVNPQAELWSWVPPQPGTYVIAFTVNYSNGGVWRENYTYVAKPANDDFAQASTLQLNSGSVQLSIDLTLAGVETDEPALGTNTPARSLWWKWTPTETQHVRFSAFASNAGSLRVDVFHGDSLNNLTRIANNDSSANHPPFSGFTPLLATAGETYFIRAASIEGMFASTGALVVEPYDAPAPGFMLLSTAAGELLNDGSIHWQAFGRVLTESGAPATNNFYLAQFYVGVSLSSLKPYWYPTSVLGAQVGQSPELNGVANQGIAMFQEYDAGEMVLVQLRAWDGYQSSYEAARAANKATARSAILSVQMGGELNGPALLSNIGDIVLRTATEGFAPARIDADTGAAGTFHLTGTPGLYGIEARDFSQAWTNVLILTNTTGNAVFTLTPTNDVTIFRSRLLD